MRHVNCLTNDCFTLFSSLSLSLSPSLSSNKSSQFTWWDETSSHSQLKILLVVHSRFLVASLVSRHLSMIGAEWIHRARNDESMSLTSPVGCNKCCQGTVVSRCYCCTLHHETHLTRWRGSFTRTVSWVIWDDSSHALRCTWDISSATDHTKHAANTCTLYFTWLYIQLSLLTYFSGLSISLSLSLFLLITHWVKCTMVCSTVDGSRNWQACMARGNVIELWKKKIWSSIYSVKEMNAKCLAVEQLNGSIVYLR